ncbi:hypothetical protein A8C32_09870 [Flavivirga aquatica]|uniref:NodB homology domain-containing protein n=1 Tax=Flavivirga aquatica TaxID=1849968 RepID=A0A1E5TEL6_9FLAO|nr:polysaccharide deacetylase family protein [Flavivirga aquatica]OEK09809.1 hypothetical protein A8C32_09870 [Flavivirga aquatica]
MAGKILKIAKTITETAERMTFNANNGDISFNAAKNVNYSAKKDLVYNSYVAPEAEQTEDLTVTKVVCDYKEVEIGKTYTFKAVQFSRKPKKGGHELKQVKWAYQLDDEGIKDFPNQGRIIGNTVVKQVTISDEVWDNKKVKIYAYIQKATDSVSVVCEVKKMKKIYLTFDDGIQPGTEEVLKVLKETDVKATFFLTGIHTKFSYEKNPERTLRVLKSIYENHEIANHSYSHANYFYSSYYRSGGVKISKDSRRTVLEDFCLNEEIITNYIKQIDNSYSKSHMMAKNQEKPFARFPGTNTWYLNESIKEIKSTSRGRKFEIAIKDSKEEADELYNKGYKIVGWDTEWHMDFGLALKAQEDIVINDTDFTKEHEAHPDDVDLYSSNTFLLKKEKIKYNETDRLNESLETVKENILDFAYHSRFQPFDDKSKKENKVILLMHERAFRYTESYKSKGRTEMDKLKKLIEELKEENFQFETLSNY